MIPTLEAVVEAAARLLAILGGIVLVGLILVTVASVTGRALVPLGLGPVPGDFELVEAGAAFAVFCFLPWCTLRGGHVSVDILNPLLSSRTRRGLDLLGNLLVAAIAVLIAWRLWYGLIDRARYNETSFILQFPIWWGYAACLPGAALFVIVAALKAARDAAALLTGKRSAGDTAA